jgi:hypothetical protein
MHTVLLANLLGVSSHPARKLLPILVDRDYDAALKTTPRAL